MKWQGQEQSDNVEIATNETRPYGDVGITRNLKSGAVSSINPIDLNNTCRGELAEIFKSAVKEPMTFTRILVNGQDLESEDCKVKVKAFQKEVDANGLNVDTMTVKTPFTSTINFMALPPPKR